MRRVHHVLVQQILRAAVQALPQARVHQMRQLIKTVYLAAAALLLVPQAATVVALSQVAVAVALRAAAAAVHRAVLVVVAAAIAVAHVPAQVARADNCYCLL